VVNYRRRCTVRPLVCCRIAVRVFCRAGKPFVLGFPSEPDCRVALCLRHSDGALVRAQHAVGAVAVGDADEHSRYFMDTLPRPPDRAYPAIGYHPCYGWRKPVGSVGIYAYCLFLVFPAEYGAVPVRSGVGCFAAAYRFFVAQPRIFLQPCRALDCPCRGNSRRCRPERVVRYIAS